jgi:hypothetical protein
MLALDPTGINVAMAMPRLFDVRQRRKMDCSDTPDMPAERVEFRLAIAPPTGDND